MNTSDINAIIDNLADRLGVAVEMLFPMLIRQAYVSGVRAIILCVIYVCVFHAICRYFQYVYITTDEDDKTGWDSAYDNDTETLHVALTVICCVSVIVLLFLFCQSLTVATNALANPEWFAVQQLLDFLS